MANREVVVDSEEVFEEDMDGIRTKTLEVRPVHYLAKVTIPFVVTCLVQLLVTSVALMGSVP